MRTSSSSGSGDVSNASTNTFRGRAGSYAITTTDSMPWLTSSTSITTPGSSKPKVRKSKVCSVVNPIFEACAQLIPNDPFWQAIFSQAALNKMPRGFLCREGNLTFKKGTKIQRLEIPRNPAEALSACMEFFTAMAGIRSTNDRDRERREMEIIQENSLCLEKCKWEEIKKKKIQDALIDDFIRRNSKLLNLSHSKFKKFSTMVNMGFLFGQFHSGSITFSNGKILSLAGLMISSDKFWIDPSKLIKDKSSRTRMKFISQEDYLSPSYKNPIDSLDGNSFLILWEKYQNLYGKKTNVPFTPRVQVIHSKETPSIPATPRGQTLILRYTDSRSSGDTTPQTETD